MGTDTKPTIPQVLPLVREYKEKAKEDNHLNCCLHIYLSNYNIEDSNMDFIIRWATERNHPHCVEMIKIIKQMSKTQRLKLAKMV